MSSSDTNGCQLVVCCLDAPSEMGFYVFLAPRRFEKLVRTQSALSSDPCIPFLLRVRLVEAEPPDPLNNHLEKETPHQFHKHTHCATHWWRTSYRAWEHTFTSSLGTSESPRAPTITRSTGSWMYEKRTCLTWVECCCGTW